jgi:UDP-N-acetylmuramate dehydrogenase
MYKEDYEMQGFNTFRVKCKTKYYYSFEEGEELHDFMNQVDAQQFKRILVLGGGSNILFSKNFQGLIIHPQKKNIEVLDNEGDIVTVRAFSGLKWDDFIQYCVEQGWQGLENLTLIPGNVGASPVQNIGAYGSEVSERISSVNCYDLNSKTFINLSSKECQFSYRKSVFKKRTNLVILSVDFRLSNKPFAQLIKLKNPVQTVLKELINGFSFLLTSIRFGRNTNWKLKMDFERIRDFLNLNIISPSIKRKLVKFIRQKTMPDPEIIGNVGCFFKSPIISIIEAKILEKKFPQLHMYPHDENHMKISAGDLIKATGWNGKRLGNVSVEKNRPLIILNHGDASGNEILEFSKAVRQDVLDVIGVKVDPEVVILE